ncbi:MAG TPA: hypothetical protein DCG85_03770 [Lachnospiraceae bacterium]|nr:hypothetical protein [Lachnospiraceae bacterium]
MDDNAYKYVLQDFTNVYIGALFTFEELIASDDCPVRFKDFVIRVICKDGDRNMSISERLLEIKENDEVYSQLQKLKLKIKVTHLLKSLDKHGNEKDTYETKELSIEDFVKDDYVHDEPGEFLIQEISFKKRHLTAMLF